ncbi:hypothetical protein FACS189490_03000 [Clostridia bacterium]|nr:hypothetical protein FACS189490_03000 [Clostridia bacterium]
MTHKGTVTLETERLILRRLTLDDAAAMFNNWAGDADVTKFLMWQTHKDIADSCRVINEWLSMYEKRDFYLWAIVLKDFGEPVGSISVVGQSEDDRKVHIGYCIGKRWWRQGITSEALKAVVKFFFEEVGVNRVESRHDPKNPNSGKVMQKAGLVYEGTLRQADHNNMGICDAAHYGIIAEDYFAAKKPPVLTFSPYDTTADREFLEAAHRETFLLTFKEEITADHLEEELAKPRDMRDGAYLNGKLVGICDLQRRESESLGDYGRVCFFYVAPEYRNMGFGGQIIAHACDWLREQGLDKLTLNTARDNFQAQRCYEKNGFVRFPDIDYEEEFGYIKRLDPINAYYDGYDEDGRLGYIQEERGYLE